MKNTIFKFTFALMVLLFSSTYQASAQADQLAEILTAYPPVFGGSHCKDLAYLDLSDLKDKNILHIKTLKLTLGKGATNARATCQMSLPLKAPLGKAISVKSFQETGVIYSKLTKGSAKFSSSVFFTASSSPSVVLKKDFLGKNKKNILLTSESFSLVTPCGGDVNLRMAKSVVAQNIVAAGLHQTSLKIELLDCGE